MHDFQEYFSRTFRVLEFSKRNVKDFPGDMETLQYSEWPKVCHNAMMMAESREVHRK